MTDQSIQTLQTLENIYPAYKGLAENAIQQLRAQEISVQDK